MKVYLVVEEDDVDYLADPEIVAAFLDKAKAEATVATDPVALRVWIVDILDDVPERVTIWHARVVEHRSIRIGAEKPTVTKSVRAVSRTIWSTEDMPPDWYATEDEARQHPRP